MNGTRRYRFGGVVAGAGSSHIRTRTQEMRHAFFVQCEVFLAVNAALALLTVGFGESFWWWPFTAVWGLGVAACGAIAYWYGKDDEWGDRTGTPGGITYWFVRRDRWVDEPGDPHRSDKPLADRPDLG